MTDPERQNESELNAIRLRNALFRLRIVWFAMLLGPISFLLVVIVQVLPNMQRTSPPIQALVWVNLGMLLTVVPVAFLIRNLIFRRRPGEDGIRPPAYVTGNIVFWAACESVSFFGIVAAMINGSLMPTILIAGAALALQTITFPVAGKLSFSESPSIR